MASALDLQPFEAPSDPYRSSPGEGIGLSDYVHSIVAGGYGVAGSLAGAAEYAFDVPRGTDLSRIQEWAQSGQEAQAEKFSPAFRRAMEATVLPGGGSTIWDKDVSTLHAIGGRAAGAIPSLIASMLPGAVVARVALAAGATAGVAGGLGTAAGGISAGAQTGGDLFNQIVDDLEKIPDKELREQSEAYDGLRRMGMSEQDARDGLIRTAVGYKPLVMGAITALTSRYGVEHAVAHRAAGAAGRGVLRGGALGAIGEASQEAIEGFSQELLAQRGVFDAKGGDAHYDWLKALEQAATGALVGGVTGGVVGAATSRPRPAGAKPQGRQLEDQTAEADTGEGDRIRANDATMDLEGVSSPSAAAGHEMAAVVAQKPAEALGGAVATPEVRTSGVTSAPASVGPDQAAALSAAQDAAPQPFEPPPIPSPLRPVVSPEVEAAITNTIDSTLAAALDPGPAAPAPAAELASSAAPAATASGGVEEALVTPEVTAVQAPPGQGGVSQPGVIAPVSPSGGATEAFAVSGTQTPGTLERSPSASATPVASILEAPGGEAPRPSQILPDVAQVRRSRKGPKDTASKREQLARGETEILGKREDEARQLARAHASLAERVLAAQQAHPYDRATMNTPQAIRSYMATLVKASEIPPDITLRRLPADVHPALAHLAQAKALQIPGRGSQKALFDFMANDISLREGGDFARTYRQVEGSTAAGVGFTEEAMPVEETAANIEDQMLDRVEKGRAEETQREVARAFEDKSPEGMKKFVTPGVSKEGTFKLEKRRHVVVPTKRPTKILSAADMKRARKDVETQPTEAQKEAGNFGKGHINIHGYDVAIETKKGGTRSGVDENGKPWSIKLPYDYGYFKRSTGADGDQIDVVIGPNLKSRIAYIVNQLNPKTGKFDEHKVFMGFDAANDARRAYKQMYDGDAAARMGAGEPVTPIILGPALDNWLAKNQTKPAIVQEPVARPTPQTEAEAAEQLAEQRLAENADVIEPEFRPLLDDAPTVSRPLRVGGVTLEGYSRWGDVARTHIKQKRWGIRGAAADLLPKIIDVLEPYIGDTRVYMVTPEVMKKLVPEFGTPPRGLYNRKDKYIVINTGYRNNPAAFAHAIVHEGTHAALNDLVENNPAAAQVLATMVREMRATIGATRLKQLPGRLAYGLTVDEHGNPNVYEFISEIMSNDEFQLLAAEMSASDSLREAVGLKETGSIWDSIVAFARKWFGMSQDNVSILELALRHAENILETDGRKAMASASEKIGSGQFRALTAGDVRDYTYDSAAGFKWGLHKKSIWAATVDQLVRRYEHLFSKGLLRRYYDTLARMETQAEDGAVEGMKIAQRAEEYRRANPQEWQRVETVISRANEDDVDPRKPIDKDPRLKGDKTRHYQRKKRFEETQRLYNELSRESKELIDEMQEFYRRSQHKRVRNLAAASLNAFNELNDGKLSQAQIAELVEHTVTGNLTERDEDNPTGKSDQEIIGDDGTFEALQTAQEMREARGMYFPMMRHGDHLVRATQKLPPLMGGEVVSQDDKKAVIHWKADSLKEAKKKYKAWATADSTADGPTMISRRVRRFMNGEEVPETIARGHPHEVVYEAVLDIQHVQTFDTDRQAREFIADAKGEFQRIDNEPMTRDQAAFNTSIASTEIANIIRMVEKRTDISADQRAIMSSAISNAAIMLQPGNRIQHRQLKRKGTRGAAYDAIRGMQAYAEAGAQADARAEHMPQLTDLLLSLRKETGKVGAKDVAKRTQVVQELEKRLKISVVNPHMPSEYVQFILRLSNIDKLASPAYHVINSLQPWMVAAPYLGGNYGNIRTMAELGKAYNAMGFGKVIWQGLRRTGQAFTSQLNTDDLHGSIRAKLSKQEDGSRLTQMFDYATELGVINDGSAMELAQAVKGGKRGWASVGVEKVDRISRQMSLAVEAVNRSVVMVAAYRLEYAQSGNHELAQQAAIDTANATQFNYAAWNQPQFFNHPLGRIAFQFKKYAQGMTALMADMVYRAFKGASPQEKRKAWKQIANLFAVQIAMAGALGLPGIELVKALSMIAAVLGVGSWGDTERWLRKLADDMLGEKWGSMVMRGVITRAMGIDLSSRVGLSDLWLYGEPKGNDRQDVMAYFGQFVGGAPAGLMFDYWDAGKDAGKGDFWKAFEKIVPIKMVSDISAAVRGRTDPSVREPMTTVEAGLKAVGLRSARLAEAGEKTGRKIAVQKDLEGRKKDLINDYLAARTASDRLKVKSKITAHNKEVAAKQKDYQLGLKHRVPNTSTMDNWRTERDARRSKIVGE